MTGQSDPSIDIIHFAHVEVKEIEAKFDKFEKLADKLEGHEEDRDSQVPWIDISMKHL